MENIEDIITRLSVPLGEQPEFVVLGVCDINGGNKAKAKIFFCSHNEFHARMVFEKLIKIDPKSILYLERTEYNKEKITFSLSHFIKDASILREKHRKSI
jgi:hypothetical protein